MTTMNRLSPHHASDEEKENNLQRAFLTRQPNDAELALLKKYLASYPDGTGNHREVDGSSRADSRQIERCLAELLHRRTTENKAFYDLVVEFNALAGNHNVNIAVC